MLLVVPSGHVHAVVGRLGLSSRITQVKLCPPQAVFDFLQANN